MRLTAPCYWTLPLWFALTFLLAIPVGATPLEDVQKLLSSGDVSQAEQLLNSHLAQQPGDREARFFLANLLARKGDMDGAYKIFHGLLDEQPNDPLSIKIQWQLAERGASAKDSRRIDVLFGQIQAAMQRGDRAKALEGLVEVVRLAPANVAALNNATQLFEQARQYKEALPYLVQLSRVRPQDVAVARRLGALYERLEDFDSAVQTYRGVLKLAPDDGETLYSLGRISQFHEKDSAAAVDYLTRAHQLMPGRADVAYLLGLNHKELGNDEAALQAFSQAVVADERFFRAHFEMGLIHEAAKRDGEALRSFQQTVRYGGDSSIAAQAGQRMALFGDDIASAGKVKAALNRGLSALADGDMEAGKLAFEEVISLVPGNTLAHYNLATAHTRSGNNDLAISSLNQALQGDPTHYLSHYGLALIYSGAGRFEEAYKAYQNVVKYAPESGPYQGVAKARVEAVQEVLSKIDVNVDARKAFKLGNKLAGERDFEGAIAAFEEAIKQDDQNPYYHFNIGIIYVEVNQIANAFKAFSQTLELKPDHIQSHFRLALFYLATGFPQQAIKSMENVIKYGTTEPEVAEAKSRLKGMQGAADEKEKALAYFLMANVLGLILKDEQGALVALEHSYTLNSDSMEIALRYAALLAQFGRFEDARVLLEPRLETHPDYLKLLSDLGPIYKNLKMYDRAEEVLSKVWESAPDNLKVIRLLSEVRRKGGDMEGGILMLEDYFERHPDDIRMLVLLSSLYAKQGNFDTAATTIDWYLSKHDETAELLYRRGLLAQALKATRRAEIKDPELEEAADDLIGSLASGQQHRFSARARYSKVDDWFRRILEMAIPGEQAFVVAAKRILDQSDKLDWQFTQTVFDFNTNVNNSATDPKAGVSSSATLSATYQLWSQGRYSIPIGVGTNHTFHYTFQTYVNSHWLSATLRTRLPGFTVVGSSTATAVRTQKGMASSTLVYTGSITGRFKFPSTLSASYTFTDFKSRFNFLNNYQQGLLNTSLGHGFRLGRWAVINLTGSYQSTVRDVVAAFRDTERTNLRGSTSWTFFLPKRNTISLNVSYSESEDIRGTNRIADGTSNPPIVPITGTLVGGGFSWGFQMYPTVRGTLFSDYSVSDLSGVISTLAPRTDSSQPVVSIIDQRQTSLNYGLSFTFQPVAGLSYVLSFSQAESVASVDVPADVLDLLTNQVIQDNINKRQQVKLTLTYAF